MKNGFKPYLVAVLLLASFFLVFDARASHSVAGWYAHSASIAGPTSSDTAACNAGKGFFRAEQVAAGVPPQNLIASLHSMDGSTCVWNTDGGLVGPYGNALLHVSKYYPLPPYADPLNIGSRPCMEGNPVNPANGNKCQVETDHVAEGAFALKFVRYYNSLGNDGRDAGFSNGWTHTYSRRLLNDGGNMVAIREDGRSIRFSLVSGAYVADSTASEKLERITSPSLGWKLTDRDDEIELYDDPGKLMSIADRAGLTHTLTYDTNGKLASVADSYGRTLTLARDSAQRIQSITMPFGVVSYGYSNTAQANLTTVTYPSAATRTYHYEHSPSPTRLTGITDENGDRFSTYTYDASNKAIATEQAGGAGKVNLVNDTSTGTRNVSVTRFVDATMSAQRTYTYESTQGIATRTGVTANPGEPCPTCGPASQTYDANANVASSVDWNGNRTDYTYDLTRNLETSRTEGLTSSGGTTPQTRTISTQWHSTLRLRTGIAEPLRNSAFVYDPDGTQCGAWGALCSRTIQATSDTDGSQGFSATPVGSPRAWSYTYNANGSALTVNGPRTDVTDLTTYAYYANNASCPTADGGHATGCRGQVETITNALSQTTIITAYNSLGQPKRIVDPNGLVTIFTYNARGRPLTRTVGGETTTYQYDLAEQLTKVTLPDGSFLSFTYDAAHRLTAIEDNLGNSIVYTLDAMGNRKLEEVRHPTNALVQTRSRVYNNLNRLLQELGATGQTTEYSYDDQGNVLTVKDPLNRITTNQYDALNRLKQVTDPANGVTQYGYDGIDQLISVSDPRSLVTGYAVNGLGNLTQQASPDTGTTAKTYDAAGNVLTQTDAKNQTTTYAYDSLNRITSITFQDGSKQTYTYDSGSNGIGRLTGITELDPALNVIAQIAYGYDQRGRVVSDTRTINAVAYSTGYRYDSFGRMDRITYPSGRSVDYGFDPLGRINAVTTTPAGGSAQPVASSIAYQPFGGVKGYTLGNGQAYTRGMDLDARIASYTLGAQSFAIGYDAASRLSFISDIGNPPNSNTYGYDDLDRLTSAVLPATVYGYSYDAVGNRLTKSTGGNTDTYAYSATSNRIASVTSSLGLPRNFTFDANGSTTADGLVRFAYDARGRLVSATNIVVPTTYSVNALGQRVRKTNLLGDTVFHYDTVGHLIAESSPTGAPIREYVWLGDILIAVINSSGTYYYIHVDHLNTPRLIANQAQQTVWRWDNQEAFGNTPPDENPSGLGTFEFSLRLPGQYFDKETNLYYNYFRDYDPSLGRYGESDPLGLAGGTNTYAYVDSDPLRLADPLGLQRGLRPRPPTWSSNLPTEAGVMRQTANLPLPTTPGDYPGINVPWSMPPGIPNNTPMCGWDCPRSPVACSPGDPQPPLVPSLFAPQSGCVWRCRQGPFIGPL